MAHVVWFTAEGKEASKGYIRGSDASRGRERRRRRGLVIKRPASRIRPPPTFSLSLSFSLHPCLQYTSRFRARSYIRGYSHASVCRGERGRQPISFAYYTREPAPCLSLSIYIYKYGQLWAHASGNPIKWQSGSEQKGERREKKRKKEEGGEKRRWSVALVSLARRIFNMGRKGGHARITTYPARQRIRTCYGWKAYPGNPLRRETWIRSRARSHARPAEPWTRYRARQPSPIGLRPILYPDRVTLTRIIMQPATYARSLSIPWREASLVGDFEGFLIAKSRLLRRCIAMDEWGWWGGSRRCCCFAGSTSGWMEVSLPQAGWKGSLRFALMWSAFVIRILCQYVGLRGFYDLGIWKRVFRDFPGGWWSLIIGNALNRMTIERLGVVSCILDECFLNGTLSSYLDFMDSSQVFV